jgi:TctA family transporter
MVMKNWIKAISLMMMGLLISLAFISLPDWMSWLVRLLTPYSDYLYGVLLISTTIGSFGVIAYWTYELKRWFDKKDGSHKPRQNKLDKEMDHLKHDAETRINDYSQWLKDQDKK